jgi:diacylglycerol kinase family enzyme
MEHPNRAVNSVIVIINTGSGTLKDRGPAGLLAQLQEAFQKRHLAADLRPVTGEQASEAARKARSERCDAIVAAGGDGTINAVASAWIGSGVALGVLPLGTLNHFARDMKVPLDVDDAIDLISAGLSRPVDVASVNGHYYLNTSVVGTYPQVVKERDSFPIRGRVSKKWALIRASLRVLRRPEPIRVTLELDGRPLERRTSFVFVGNNVYSLKVREQEQRARLDEGVLSVLCPHRLELGGWLRMAWRALSHTLHESDEMDCWTAREVVLRLHTPTVQVAVDGEVLSLETPLHYRVHPGALRVICPPPSA